MEEIILSDNEIQMLNALATKANETAQLVESLLIGKELTYAQALSAIGYICAKELAESVEIGSEQKRMLRKLGQEYEEQGLPEKRFWQLFFFSSRRRHTRLTCDWSSDVCSSDLGIDHPARRTSSGRS